MHGGADDPIDLSRRRRFTDTQESPQEDVAAHHAEELGGGQSGVGDVEDVIRVQARQVAGKAGRQALRTGMEEHLGQLREPAAFGDNEAKPAESLWRKDDVQQSASHRLQSRRRLEACAFVRDQGLQHVLGVGRDDRFEQPGLGTEMAVNRLFRDAGPTGHGVHAGGTVAFANQDLGRRAEDRLALKRRSPGSAVRPSRRRRRFHRSQ